MQEFIEQKHLKEVHGKSSVYLASTKELLT